MKYKILGISASLRNARFGLGETCLTHDLKRKNNFENLDHFVKKHTKILLDDFFNKGRKNKEPFNKLYHELRKLRGDRGLSNSEASLCYALWSIFKKKIDIDYISLSNVFKPDGSIINIDRLKSLILKSDGIILSGPVYFGDRSSLSQCFFEFLKNDKNCLKHVKKLPFAGIAVGAKRNGGQETTLIYQMIDALNLGMSVVGNGHETTAQYGGTAVAGDIGTFSDDKYGIETSMSTGNRIADVVNMIKESKKPKYHSAKTSKFKIGIWLLQDSNKRDGENYLKKILKKISIKNYEFKILNVIDEKIRPCIACDICPTHIGPSNEYRCIIKQNDDFFKKYHQEIVDVDSYILAAYSPNNTKNLISYYQQFIERTRYLRRDDYLMGNKLVTPLVLSEIGTNQNLHIRMITSLIRHQTILHKPLIGYLHKSVLLNSSSLISDLEDYIKFAKQISLGKLNMTFEANRYQHLGYKVSKEKYENDKEKGYFQIVDNDRIIRDNKKRKLFKT